jgi:hypothetical protein
LLGVNSALAAPFAVLPTHVAIHDPRVAILEGAQGLWPRRIRQRRPARRRVRLYRSTRRELLKLRHHRAGTPSKGRYGVRQVDSESKPCQVAGRTRQDRRAPNPDYS